MHGRIPWHPLITLPPQARQSSDVSPEFGTLTYVFQYLLLYRLASEPLYMRHTRKIKGFKYIWLHRISAAQLKSGSGSQQLRWTWYVLACQSPSTTAASPAPPPWIAYLYTTLRASERSSTLCRSLAFPTSGFYAVPIREVFPGVGAKNINFGIVSQLECSGPTRTHHASGLPLALPPRQAKPASCGPHFFLKGRWGTFSTGEGHVSCARPQMTPLQLLLATG